MSEQVQEVEQEQAVLTDAELSADEAEELAAFESTGDEVRGDTPPTDEADVEAQPEEVEAEGEQPETEQPEAVEAQQDEPQVAGLKESELTALLAKLPKIDEIGDMTTSEIRKLHGKFGEINRQILELQKNGVGTGKAAKLADAKFEQLKSEYPELAEVLIKDFGEIGFGGGLSEDDVDKRVETRVSTIKEELDKQMNVNLLRIQHRDYMDVYKSDQFKVFMQTLPAEDQEKIGETWDAVYLGDIFTKFKDWRNERTQGRQERQSRLKAAITPKTNAAPVKAGAMTEEDGFAAAFKT